MGRDRVGLATLVVVLLLLQAPAAYAISGPSHQATSGVTYETNSGLEVTLADDREVEAAPFADNRTFRSDGVSLSAPGDAAVTVTDQTFDGPTMQLAAINATNAPITATRDDLARSVTVSGGADAAIIHDIGLGDNTTDIEVTASSQTTITVNGLSDVGPVQVVDSTGDPVAGDSTTSDGSAELSLSAGEYSLRLQEAPEQLEVRNVLTQELVQNDSNGNPINVQLEFFGSDGAVQTRNTTDGTIDLAGLPTDQRFAVTVDAGDEFITRQAIIPSVLDQQTVYLLPQDSNVTTVEPRFVIEDPSNQFDSESSEIILQRPITTNGTTEFVAVAGDRVGLNGYDVVLEKDQRYRLVVINPDTGARRQVGEFTPTVSERVELAVQDVEFDSVSQVDGLEWTARYRTNENNADEIQFVFRDSFETRTLSYVIHERGNDSNVLVQDTATGNVTVSEIVPPGEENTVWVVEWETTRTTGETLSATRPVSSDNLPVGPQGLDQNWQTIIAMLVLVAVAGLFGAANPGVGGIATAMVGGVFFLLGWLPDSTGGLMVGLAIFVSVLSYGARRARGATA